MAREIVVALPANAEISAEDRIELGRSFAEQHFVAKGLAVQLDVHGPHEGEVESEHANWHAHLLITTRRLEGDRFAAKKARDLDPEVRRGGGRAMVAEGEAWGELWRDHQNQYFEEHGLGLRVDSTATYAAPHIGPVRMRVAGSEIVERAEEIRRANEEAARDPEQVLMALTRHNATFTERDLDRFLAKHLAAAGERASVKARVLEHGEMVPLYDRETGEAAGRFTIRAVREQERGALADAAEIAERRTQAVPALRPGRRWSRRICAPSPPSTRARARARVEAGNQKPWPADKVERWAIDRLIPYAKNARTHTDAQVAAIAASIKEWGWTTPALVGEDGGLIAGHARVLAARQLGIAEIPVMVAAGWSEAQKRAYVLADNQLAITGSGWDPELLRLELGELKLGGFDLSLTGFGELELKDLLAERTEGLTDPDDAPAVPEHPVSQTGDLWLLGRHRLLCGDSTVATDVERVLGGVAPHLMVTDPPYGVNYDPAWRNRAGRSINGTTQRIATGAVIKPIGARAVGKVVNDDRADWREAWALFPGSVGARARRASGLSGSNGCSYRVVQSGTPGSGGYSIFVVSLYTAARCKRAELGGR